MNNRSTMALLILGMTSAPVFAQEVQPEALHQSIVSLIKQFADNGMLSKEDSEKLLQEAEQSASVNVSVPSGITTEELVAPNGAAAKEAAAREAAAREAVAKEAAAKEAAAREAAAREAVASSIVATADVPIQNNAPLKDPVKPEVVHVRYVPEVVRQEIKEEIKQEVLAQAKAERWGDPGAMPDWLSRISWDGDFRVRYERDGFPSGNFAANQYNTILNGPILISNTTETHNYMRVQARLGMKATISDYTLAAFRLTTGTTTNPVSTNQTLGTGFNKSTVLLDRAYVQSTPYNWLTLDAGKIANPWLSTDLVWDTDVNFEGVASQMKLKMSDQMSGFVTVGAFPFQDIQKSDTVLANSKWLFGAQLSGQWTGMDSSTAQFGVALYDFQKVEGIPSTAIPNPYSNTAAQSMQKGNSLVLVNVYDQNSSPASPLPPSPTELANPLYWGLASKFRELNITGKYDWAAFDPMHVMIVGDYVRNLGFDAAEIASRIGTAQLSTPLRKQVTGYQSVLTVGSPRVKKRGDWQASVAYKYIERDAVLDALTDSDFHLGGTNAKGFIIGGSYGLDKETSLGLRWISTDQIDGPQLSIDTLQLDLNVKF